MRFLLFIGILYSTLVVTTSNASAAPRQGCGLSTITQTILPPSQHGIVLINEVLLFPGRSWTCAGATSLPGAVGYWIELYNPQNQNFDLYKARAAIDYGPDTTPFWLPFGAAIAAHDLFAVFPADNAPFRNTATFTLRLLFNGVVIDQVALPQLKNDQSYARIPDGASGWQTTDTPTIGTSNRQTPALLTPSPTHTRGHRTTTGGTTTSTGQGVNSKGASRDTSTSHSTGAPPNDTTAPTGNATQPAWGSLQLPPGKSTPAATTPVGDTPANNTTSQQAVAKDTTDLPRNVLLTVLVIVLAGALFLCWRRFKPT